MPDPNILSDIVVTVQIGDDPVLSQRAYVSPGQYEVIAQSLGRNVCNTIVHQYEGERFWTRTEPVL